MCAIATNAATETATATKTRTKKVSSAQIEANRRNSQKELWAKV